MIWQKSSSSSKTCNIIAKQYEWLVVNLSNVEVVKLFLLLKVNMGFVGYIYQNGGGGGIFFSGYGLFQVNSRNLVLLGLFL